jgi:hypothetical protein
MVKLKRKIKVIDSLPLEKKKKISEILETEEENAEDGETEE